MTKEDIESLGWKCVAIARNGGTLEFAWSDQSTLLEYNGDNFIFKKNNPEKLNFIYIKKLNLKKLLKEKKLEFKDLYQGDVSDILVLKNIMLDLNL